MKFLADAHISRALDVFLRDQGHECTVAAYLPQKLPDEEVLRIAVREDRIVSTADKGFRRIGLP